MWLPWKLVTGIEWKNKIKNHKLNNPHIHKIYVGYLKMRCCGFYQNVPYQIILVKFSDMHIDLLNPNIQRLCQNCNVVEDEIHFVMDCNMTINISERRIRLDNITVDYNKFEKLDKISQSKYSFSTETTLHFAWPGKCLHTCLENVSWYCVVPYLDFLLWYSTGEFQALQLIVVAEFRAVDW